MKHLNREPAEGIGNVNVISWVMRVGFVEHKCSALPQ